MTHLKGSDYVEKLFGANRDSPDHTVLFAVNGRDSFLKKQSLI